MTTATAKDYGLQVSFRDPRGALVNVPFNDADDLRAKLAVLDEVAGDIATTGTLLMASQVAADGLNNPTSHEATSTPTAPPQTPTASQAPGGKTCAHGQMTFRTGVSKKTQRPYSAYFCPTPQGTAGQCDPIFT